MSAKPWSIIANVILFIKKQYTSLLTLDIIYRLHSDSRHPFYLACLIIPASITLYCHIKYYVFNRIIYKKAVLALSGL